ncbi:hypothetical protein G5C51_32090 [Streptomyces sp. A7024]|uniref:Uncharacterized protein n=1 Tax=Streptomyces coryli TaxID=1128680 RepID=A0A6G4UA09_9ACTN|nr:hypothetical protein [Streptomyces coryli]NGN68526.1 hypothetical protein [Streptomyces coryli]
MTATIRRFVQLLPARRTAPPAPGGRPWVDHRPLAELDALCVRAGVRLGG